STLFPYTTLFRSPDQTTCLHTLSDTGLDLTRPDYTQTQTQTTPRPRPRPRLHPDPDQTTPRLRPRLHPDYTQTRPDQTQTQTTPRPRLPTAKTKAATNKEIRFLTIQTPRRLTHFE